MTRAEVVTIRHWRVVEDTDGGIRFSISSREEPRPDVAFGRAAYWAGPGTHIEVWDQTYTVTPSKWARVDSDRALVDALDADRSRRLGAQ